MCQHGQFATYRENLSNGYTNLTNGQYQAAIQQLLVASQTDTTKAIPLALAGQAAYQLGNYTQASQYLAQAESRINGPDPAYVIIKGTRPSLPSGKTNARKAWRLCTNTCGSPGSAILTSHTILSRDVSVRRHCASSAGKAYQRRLESVRNVFATVGMEHAVRLIRLSRLPADRENGGAMIRGPQKGWGWSVLLTLIAGLLLVLQVSCSTIPYTDTDKAEDLMDAGRYDEAIAEYSRSINLLPNNPAPYVGRGYAYEKLGSMTRPLQITQR